MTPRPPATPLRSRLRAVHARVRRALVARHVLRASAASIVVLAFCVTAGLALPRDPATAWLRLGLFVAGAAVAMAWAARGALRDLPRWDPWLESLEERFTELRSFLRNALDLEASPGAHTSGELAEAVRDSADRRLAATPLGDSVPSLAARTPVTATSAAVLSLTAAMLFAPGPTLDAWRTLWAPATAAPPVTLEVEPGSVTLVPGASFAVRARVAGSVAAPRLTGEGASPVPVLESSAEGARRWRFDLPPVTRARDYAVKVGSATSPRYHIALAGEPRPVSFSSTITAPGYARLPLQAIAGTRGDLSALPGSRAAVEVTFDRDLESLSAAIDNARAVGWSEITPRRWRGTVPVEREGSYELDARAATGAARFRYRLSLLADAPPVLTVVLPVGDLDLPAGQWVPYDVLAQDDLGVSSLRLEWRKAAGDPWREQELAAFSDQPREARATARWDASALALLPGESGVFRFVAIDNGRGGARGRTTSGEFRVRFPSLSELYTALDDKQDNVARALEKAQEQSKELQKSLDKLQRQPQSPQSQSPSFERAEEMKKAAERQQSVAQQVKDAAQQMRESLDQAAERQAFQEQLQQKLREMSELLKDIQSEEFKKALEKMKDALQKMDRRAMEEQLPQLQQQNKEMMQQLERSLELLKQLREEERLDALARRADDLKQKQDALNREHAEQAADHQPDPAKQDSRADSKNSDSKSPEPKGDPKGDKPSLSERQQKAAEESRDLARNARDAAKASEQPETKQRMQEAAQELEQEAASKQDAAAQQASEGDSKSAKSSGQKASESLGKASQSMKQGADSQQQEQDERNLAAVRRASQDLVSLSRASQDNLDARKPSPSAAEKQTDLSEGVARVADSLMTLSQQTPFLSNKITAALGRAMQGLQQSGREMSQSGRERGEASGRRATASLNEAVKELRAAESSMCQRPGAGTGGKTSSQKLGEVGERQSQLNQKARQMARKLSRQMSMQQGDEAEMRRLADEQRRIREQLDEVRRDEEAKEEAKRNTLGRLDQTQKDMEKAEEKIRQGQMDPELEQQQTKILSRLLDASRSINRRDFDPEREARRGADVAHSSPAALNADLFRENDRLRQDLLKADADRVPARYRSLIEAYLRSLNGAPAGNPSASPKGTPRETLK